MNSRVLWLVFLIAVGSCKSKKTAVNQTTLPPATIIDAKNIQEQEAILKNIDGNANTFNFYQAKASASYKDDKQNLNLDISIVMEKDQYIWMSVTALLGIEVVRIMITNDSIKILDRLHRQYIVADFGYIQRMSNMPLNLQNLQNMIVGNTIFANSVQKSEVDTIMGVLAVYTAISRQKQNTFYSPQFKAQRTTISEENQSRELKITYNSFSIFLANAYPNNIDINIRAEKNVSCKFELSNFAFEKKREVQFSVPSSYEVVKP